MLVKDVELKAAIVDLVDNCVDGARNIKTDRNFEGLYIRIEANPEYFRIVDNCGGISVDLARQYAFRFGRPKKMPSIPYSIGHFGIGMKRAFFKLGTKFRVESTTETSRFVVEEDVNEWKEKEKWEFQFLELEEKRASVPLDQRGTIVTVDTLHESVAKDFGLENFLIRLKNKIRQDHRQVINNGLAISLNGLPLGTDPLELLSSDELQPAFYEETIIQGEDTLNVKIYAGLARSVPEKAGWYIYCNGRMIMGADQTLTTGWGEGGEVRIPKYHNRSARFRGYTFFDSDNASWLPWNTTKTGVDIDSPIYRAMRLKMITLMRPVVDFLTRLAREKDREPDYRTLENAVDNAPIVTMTHARTSEKFISPKPSPKPPSPKKGRILYYKSNEQIEIIKKLLKVATNKAVGEKTFDSFFDRECKE